jgi:hypothetical protein
MMMDELDFEKAPLARLPTRRNQAFTPLLIVVATAFSRRGARFSGGIAAERISPLN